MGYVGVVQEDKSGVFEAILPETSMKIKHN